MSLPRNAWAQIRTALSVAIGRASGFDDQHILWGYQNRNAPAMDYIELALSGTENPGQDGVVTSTDLTRVAGQEIRSETIGFREMTLTVQVFTRSVVDSIDDGHDALAVAELIRSSLILEGIRNQLARVGVSFLGLAAPVNYLPTIVSVGFRGSAVLEIRCSVPAIAAVEYGGYIARVRGTATAHGSEIDPESPSFSAP